MTNEQNTATTEEQKVVTIEEQEVIDMAQIENTPDHEAPDSDVVDLNVTGDAPATTNSVEDVKEEVRTDDENSGSTSMLENEHDLFATTLMGSMSDKTMMDIQYEYDTDNFKMEDREKYWEDEQIRNAFEKSHPDDLEAARKEFDDTYDAVSDMHYNMMLDSYENKSTNLKYGGFGSSYWGMREESHAYFGERQKSASGATRNIAGQWRLPTESVRANIIDSRVVKLYDGVYWRVPDNVDQSDWHDYKGDLGEDFYRMSKDGERKQEAMGVVYPDEIINDPFYAGPLYMELLYQGDNSMRKGENINAWDFGGWTTPKVHRNKVSSVARAIPNALLNFAGSIVEAIGAIGVVGNDLILGEDSDGQFRDIATNWVAAGESFGLSVSEAGKRDDWSLENTSNLVGDIASQLLGAKAIASLAVGVTKRLARKTLTDQLADTLKDAAAASMRKQAKNSIKTATKQGLKVSDDLIARSTIKASDLSKNQIRKYAIKAGKLDPSRQLQAKVAKHSSRGVLTMIATKDAWQVAELNGLDRREAAAVSLATLVAMYGANSLFNWAENSYEAVAAVKAHQKLIQKGGYHVAGAIKNVKDKAAAQVASGAISGEAGEKIVEKGVANAIRKYSKSIGDRINQVGTKAWKGLGKVGETINPDNQVIGRINTVLEGAVMESFEEMAETLSEHGVQQVYNLFDYMSGEYDQEGQGRYKDIFDRGYWDEFSSELAMSAVGGALGGAMAKTVMSKKFFQKGPWTKQERDTFIAVAASGELGSLSIAVDKLHKKGELGPKDISTEFDTDKKRFLTMQEAGENAISMNDANRELLMQSMNYAQTVAESVGGPEALKAAFDNNPELKNTVGQVNLSREIYDMNTRLFEIYENSEDDGNGTKATPEVSKEDVTEKTEEEQEKDKDKKAEILADSSGLTKQEADEVMDIKYRMAEIQNGVKLEKYYLQAHMEFGKDNIFIDRTAENQVLTKFFGLEENDDFFTELTKASVSQRQENIGDAAQRMEVKKENDATISKLKKDGSNAVEIATELGSSAIPHMSNESRQKVSDARANFKVTSTEARIKLDEQLEDRFGAKAIRNNNTFRDITKDMSPEDADKIAAFLSSFAKSVVTNQLPSGKEVSMADLKAVFVPDADTNFTSFFNDDLVLDGARKMDASQFWSEALASDNPSELGESMGSQLAGLAGNFKYISGFNGAQLDTIPEITSTLDDQLKEFNALVELDNKLANMEEPTDFDESKVDDIFDYHAVQNSKGEGDKIANGERLIASLNALMKEVAENEETFDDVARVTKALRSLEIRKAQLGLMIRAKQGLESLRRRHMATLTLKAKQKDKKASKNTQEILEGTINDEIVKSNYDEATKGQFNSTGIQGIEESYLRRKQSKGTITKEESDRLKVHEDYNRNLNILHHQLENYSVIIEQLQEVANKNANPDHYFGITKQAMNKSIADQVDMVSEMIDTAFTKDIPPALDDFKIYATAFDKDSASDEDALEASAELAKVYQFFYNMDSKEKSQLFQNYMDNNVVNSGESRQKLSRFRMILDTDLNDFYSRYKAKLEEGVTHISDANQELAALYVASHATSQLSENYNKAIEDSPSSNIVFIGGAQGSGKTTMALGLGAKIAQEMLGETNSAALMVANNNNQIKAMMKTADSFGVKTKTIAGDGGMTTKALTEALQRKDRKELFDGIATIYIDEATFIQHNTDKTKDSQLRDIDEAVSAINNSRDNNTPKLKIVLLGDPAQNGHLNAKGAPENPGMLVNQPSYSIDKNDKLINRGNKGNIILSSPYLTKNYRSSVSAHQEVLDKLLRFTTPIGNKVQVLTEIEGEYGKLDDGSGRLGGVNFIQNPDMEVDFYNNVELATNIRDQIKENSEFSVGIIVGDNIEIPSNSAMGKLITEFPNNISKVNHIDVQGAEFDYAIISFDENSIGNYTDKTGPAERGAQQRKISTSIGRARLYAHVLNSTNRTMTSKPVNEVSINKATEPRPDDVERLSNYRASLIPGESVKTTTDTSDTSDTGDTDVENDPAGAVKNANPVDTSTDDTDPDPDPDPDTDSDTTDEGNVDSTEEEDSEEEPVNVGKIELTEEEKEKADKEQARRNNPDVKISDESTLKEEYDNAETEAERRKIKEQLEAIVEEDEQELPDFVYQAIRESLAASTQDSSDEINETTTERGKRQKKEAREAQANLDANNILAGYSTIEKADYENPTAKHQAHLSEYQIGDTFSDPKEYNNVRLAAMGLDGTPFGEFDYELVVARSRDDIRVKSGESKFVENAFVVARHRESNKFVIVAEFPLGTWKDLGKDTNGKKVANSITSLLDFGEKQNQTPNSQIPTNYTIQKPNRINRKGAPKEGYLGTTMRVKISNLKTLLDSNEPFSKGKLDRSQESIPLEEFKEIVQANGADINVKDIMIYTDPNDDLFGKAFILYSFDKNQDILSSSEISSMLHRQAAVFGPDSPHKGFKNGIGVIQLNYNPMTFLNIANYFAELQAEVGAKNAFEIERRISKEVVSYSAQLKMISALVEIRNLLLEGNNYSDIFGEHPGDLSQNNYLNEFKEVQDTKRKIKQFTRSNDKKIILNTFKKWAQDNKDQAKSVADMLLNITDVEAMEFEIDRYSAPNKGGSAKGRMRRPIPHNVPATNVMAVIKHDKEPPVNLDTYPESDEEVNDYYHFNLFNFLYSVQTAAGANADLNDVYGRLDDMFNFGNNNRPKGMYLRPTFVKYGRRNSKNTVFAEIDQFKGIENFFSVSVEQIQTPQVRVQAEKLQSLLTPVSKTEEDLKREEEEKAKARKADENFKQAQSDITKLMTTPINELTNYDTELDFRNDLNDNWGDAEEIIENLENELSSSKIEQLKTELEDGYNKATEAYKRHSESVSNEPAIQDSEAIISRANELLTELEGNPVAQPLIDALNTVINTVENINTITPFIIDASVENFINTAIEKDIEMFNEILPALKGSLPAETVAKFNTILKGVDTFKNTIFRNVMTTDIATERAANMFAITELTPEQEETLRSIYDSIEDKTSDDLELLELVSIYLIEKIIDNAPTQIIDVEAMEADLLELRRNASEYTDKGYKAAEKAIRDKYTQQNSQVNSTKNAENKIIERLNMNQPEVTVDSIVGDSITSRQDLIEKTEKLIRGLNNGSITADDYNKAVKKMASMRGQMQILEDIRSSISRGVDVSPLIDLLEDSTEKTLLLDIQESINKDTRDTDGMTEEEVKQLLSEDLKLGDQTVEIINSTLKDIKNFRYLVQTKSQLQTYETEFSEAVADVRQKTNDILSLIVNEDLKKEAQEMIDKEIMKIEKHVNDEVVRVNQELKQGDPTEAREDNMTPTFRNERLSLNLSTEAKALINSLEGKAKQDWINIINRDIDLTPAVLIAQITAVNKAIKVASKGNNDLFNETRKYFTNKSKDNECK